MGGIDKLRFPALLIRLDVDVLLLSVVFVVAAKVEAFCLAINVRVLTDDVVARAVDPLAAVGPHAVVSMRTPRARTAARAIMIQLF